MSKIADMTPFRTPDGTDWGVEVELPTPSNAMIVFHHPDGRTSRKDRYAWLDWRGPEANNVTAHVPNTKVRAALSQTVLSELFEKSMPIGFGRPAFSPA